MSQSTPINMLRRDSPSMDMDNNMSNQFEATNSDSQLVEDILKEMGESPGLEQQSNINSQSYQYAMDNSQIPSYKANLKQDQNGFYDDRYYSEKMMHQQEKKK